MERLYATIMMIMIRATDGCELATGSEESQKHNCSEHFVDPSAFRSTLTRHLPDITSAKVQHDNQLETSRTLGDTSISQLFC